MVTRLARAESTEQPGSHYIIAIGASAGGLEAIHTFFDHMSESPNCSFVIIQHLSPDHKSLLVELVGKHTHMTVIEAEHDVKLLRNHVYIIPNNKLITVRKNKLFLADKPPAKVPNNAVDVFLYSLANEKKELAVAIILSGTGTDGTKGIEAIKEAGGLVIVQDPSTAKFDGMPNSAIASGSVDLVLPPSLIPSELLIHLQDAPLQSLQRDINDDILEQIFALIHRENQFDFQYYKTPTLIRRIARRMAQQNFKKASDYVVFLNHNPAECKQLGKDFLIGVTKFFRDTEAFEALRLNVLPAIIESKADDEPIQVWVSACSTGEEAYSIAILIDQMLQTMDRKLEVKIFATDIDEVHIEIASRGAYAASIEKDVTPDVLNSYFTQKGPEYVIISRIRKQIVFARHNIIKDPPFIKKDIVTCRNMLIYMSPVLQQRVYAILLFATRKDGYLFFGSSETPTFIKNQIMEVNSKWKIYKKIGDSRPLTYQLAAPERRRPAVDRSITRNYPEKTETRNRILWEEFERVLSEDLNYTAFYIDQNFDLKKAIGNYSKILSLPNSDFRFNLLRMVPTETATILGAEIKKAWKSKEKVILKSLRLTKDNETETAFRVVIKPPEDPENEMTLVTLVETEAPARVFRESVDDKLSIRQQEYILSLEEEVRELKYNLQLAAEDQETTHEELQSSNEELLSANEELQSSNEELQSVNEELHTLNTEHQMKIRELLELNDDLNNYFRSIDIGQIFLDKNLHIRKFNPASAKMINFIESDIGRPITHISTNIAHDKLLDDVGYVLKKNETIEKEVQLLNGKNLLMRILPYVTRDKIVAGVIISFVDITTITNLNNIIRGVFNSSQSAILAFQAVRDHESHIVDFRVLTANHAAQQMFGHAVEDIKGKSLKRDFAPLATAPMIDNYLAVVQKNKSIQTDLFLPERERWLEVSIVKMMDGFVTTFTDVTDKKVSEARLKKNYVELITVKENLKKLNAELESKVADRTRELTTSEERFRLVARATNDALWDWDFVNNTVWWSETFFQMFHYGNRENPFTRGEWLEKIHPEDRERVQESIHNVINSADTQWMQEYRLQKGDGTYATILDRGYVLHDEHQTPYRMLGSMFDLTAQKNAEREIINTKMERTFLAESMPLMVWTTDSHGHIDYANNEFETYTGLSKSVLMDKGLEVVIFSDDLHSFHETWKDSVATKRDFQDEVRIRHISGGYRWNLIAGKARHSSDGEFASWVITAIDIHEQKNLNQLLEDKVARRTKELQQLNQALERSNHDLQQFASVASHDLQEPLRKIHMFSQRVKDQHLAGSKEAGVFLDKVMQASNRMKSLIANVLSFSKLSGDRDHFEWTDLHRIVADLLEDFEIAIKEKAAEVTIETLPHAEVIPGQMRQVFQNLLSNALKFSRPEVTPVIRIYGREEQGGKCTIIVEDNGIGFEKEYEDTIFQLFQRLHSKDKYEGSGIGLAITKKIIEKHNGAINVNSRKGQGSTFEIRLPLRHTTDNQE